MTEPMRYDVPIPPDPSKVTAFLVAGKWMRGIVSLEIEGDYMTAVIRWNGGQHRRLTLSLDAIQGWQEGE